MKQKLLSILTLLLCVCSGAWGQTLIETDNFETTSGSGNTYAVGGFIKNDCTISQASESRTGGTYSIKTAYNGTGDKAVKSANSTISVAKNDYLHVIAWAKMESGDETAEGNTNQAGSNSYIGGNGKGTYVDLSASIWKQVTSAKKASNDVSNAYVLLQRKHSAKLAVLFDDVVIYTSSNSTTDIVAPTSATSADATVSAISWTVGSDANTGVQKTLIFKRTSGSADDLTLNNQGVYSLVASEGPSTDQSGHWTLVAVVNGDATSYEAALDGSTRYAIVHRDLAYNYSTPTYVTTPSTVTYEVTYKANNGTEEADVVENVTTVGDCPNTFSVPTGKIFAGWNTEANGSGDDYVVGADVTSALTLFAQWDNVYTVTYNSNGGSSVASQNVVNGNTAEEPTDPTRLNYTFLGWQLSGSDYNFDTPVTGNITLDATWSRNTIKESDDIVISSGTTLNTGGTLSVSASPSAGTSGGGINFAGNITTASDKPTRYIQFTIPSGSTATVKNITVSSNSIIIRDDIDGVTLNEHVYYKSDDTENYNKEMPAGTYYIGRGVGSGTVMTACSLTLTTPAKEVTVKSLGEDDQVIKVTTGETLGNIFLAATLPTPVLDGYTFNGWKNAADDSAVDNDDVITESMTIYADFTPESATVSANIPTSKWGTYCSNYYLDFGDENTEVLAYTVSDFNASTLEITYEKVTGVVPAGTGLLLYAPENGSKAIVTSAEAALAPTNKLKGFLEATSYSADGDERYLGMSGGSWKVLSAGTIPANKAVLKVTADEVDAINTALSSGAKFTVIINDGEQSETTGISEELRVKSEESSSAYNLAGQKVGKEYKGIVIVNGKKYLRK